MQSLLKTKELDCLFVFSFSIAKRFNGGGKRQNNELFHWFVTLNGHLQGGKNTNFLLCLTIWLHLNNLASVFSSPNSRLPNWQVCKIFEHCSVKPTQTLYSLYSLLTLSVLVLGPTPNRCTISLLSKTLPVIALKKNNHKIHTDHLSPHENYYDFLRPSSSVLLLITNNHKNTRAAAEEQEFPLRWHFTADERYSFLNKYH